jgi:excisionase family DNA binding protein
MRVSPMTIRRRIKEGELAAVRVGRKVRVPKEAVDQLPKPIEPTARKQPLIKGKPLTFEDPLWKLVGQATDAQPTDSSKKHEYLAEA